MCENCPCEENNQQSDDILTDSDDDIPELEEENEQEHQNIINQRERILSNLNNLIRNIQVIDHAAPRRLSRQQSFEYFDNDLQSALMASMEEQKNEDFLTHPDTQHDLTFDEVLSDIDSDDDLNTVD